MGVRLKMVFIAWSMAMALQAIVFFSGSVEFQVGCPA
jgi:hypothetical protein